MYLDAAFSPSLADDVVAEADGEDLKWRLWRQVQIAFPDLFSSHVRLEQGGGDHLLLIANDRRVFRFPRPGTHGLELEIAVLRDLRERLPIAIPDYDIIDPAGGFASYMLIAGLPLTFARFSALPSATVRGMLADAAMLLSSLHALEPRTFKPVECWPRMWSPPQFVDRIRRARLPVLADRVPRLAVPIREFLDRFESDQSPRDVVLHGDLVDDHLLIDEQTGRLAGIIDFGDVALGDPAHDFLGFWEYGTNAAAYAVAAYGQVDADPTLLARSRSHFIRYRIDQLFEMIADGAGDDAIQERSAALVVLLAEPATLTVHD